MARVYTCGFEIGSLLAEPTIDGTVPVGYGPPSLETTIVRSGTYSIKIVPPSGDGQYVTLGSSAPGAHYCRAYVRITVLPSSARMLFGSSSVSAAGVYLNPDGTLTLKEGSNVLGTSSTALTDTSRWYRFELKVFSGSQELRIDGTTEATGTTANVALIYRFGASDAIAATYTAYWDDAAADTTDWCGEGKALLSRPASLNAAGGWVEGDGAGTANIAAALATRPPPGVASASETNATNAESPTNSASDNLDLNMQSYTTVGIASGDTVNYVAPLVRHGEDIATNTKNGACRIMSNPTESAEDTFTFGADGGAHGAEQGQWRTTLGAHTSGSGVTLGTQPVLRIGKRTATTRVVCADFAGLYIDYTPATDRYADLSALTVPRQAVHRAAAW